jgi:hypothetical protein
MAKKDMAAGNWSRFRLEPWRYAGASPWHGET